MRAPLAALLAGTLITGCNHLPWPAGGSGKCPEVVTGEAWINTMPGPSAPQAALIVNLRLASPDRWTLSETSGAGQAGRLELELLPGGTGHPGNAAWRGSAASKVTSVDILCQGKAHHHIGEILIVR